MSEEVQRSGTYAPPVTPLTSASPSDQLGKCLDSYATSVREIEKYRTLITSRDIQRDCEGKSSSEYRLMIWQAALSLNECALKENIMCIVPLAVEVATGKNLPAEISESIYDMIFSNKAWTSHQLRNNEQNKQQHDFLSSTKRGLVYIENTVEEQPRKKRWIPKVEDPQSGYAKRPFRAQEQKPSQNMLDRNETATIDTLAEQRKPCLDLNPAESLQTLLHLSGIGASSPGTHASGTTDILEDWNPTEKMEASSNTALNSVEPSESLNSRSEHSTQSSHRHPSTTTNNDTSEDARDSIDLDDSNPTPDGEDEGFWFYTESPDLYFQTGIEI
ncbi:hypothetical protein HO173_009565 [Letharia columbiana]|uniref:Uncharacterized protein n=1 Tax=Letharia columbiana TaxID=112416 RepID=A0A8H6FP85_9LECA|nr:uncharacterized protein HO173_009565 [Letharia columbiana]KAF6232182.1 hypothetical protein HO173_009565 [Letharia columbiana]